MSGGVRSRCVELRQGTVNSLVYSCLLFGQVNVKGTVMTIRSFFPTQKPDAKIIAITSNAFIFPSDMLRGTSAYNISKLAQAKAVEFLAAEYPDTFFGLVHPGLIETDLVRVAKTDDMEKLMQEGLLQFDPGALFL